VFAHAGCCTGCGSLNPGVPPTPGRVAPSGFLAALPRDAASAVTPARPAAAAPAPGSSPAATPATGERPALVEALFRVLDLDGDQAISADEFYPLALATDFPPGRPWPPEIRTLTAAYAGGTSCLSLPAFARCIAPDRGGGPG
jgi:hypothetical protein